MSRIFKKLDWICDSTLRTAVGLIVLGGMLVFGALVTHAATPTSYVVHDVPDMTLAVRISAAQTTGIKINWPRRNGVQYAYPTTSGGILLFTRSDGYIESIYYSRAYNNSSTKTFTLSGTIVRDIQWNSPTSFVSGGNGVIMTPGAKVRLSINARELNLSIFKDRSNVLSASGSISFSGSGTFQVPTYGTTTIQTAQDLSPQSGHFSCVTATGLCYYYMGGSWNTIANGATSNASDTVAGKVQIITLADQRTKTSTGSTGAQSVLSPRWLVMTGSVHGTYNAQYRGYLPLLNNTGALSTTIGGTGLINAVSGSLLLAQGSGAFRTISYPQGTATGNVIVWSGKQWAPSAPIYCPIVNSNYTQSTDTVNSSTAENMVSTSRYLISTGSLVLGQSYEIVLKGTGLITTGNTLTARVHLGANTIQSDGIFTATDNTQGSWQIVGTFTIVTAGASGKAIFYFKTDSKADNTHTFTDQSSTVISIDTTKNNLLYMTGQADASSASHYLRANQVKYSRCN